jgi:hypothetical protein
MKNNRIIGGLLIAGATAVLIPYTFLTSMFEYPAILRQETAVILTKFHEGGSTLIWTWFTFAIAGTPLLPAYIMIGQKFETKTSLVRVATIIGVIGLVVQMVGLLRWTFVVPVLANTFINATDEATKAATIVSFKTIHQFGGVILGENLGQLFTIAYTVMISLSFGKLKLFPKWVNWLGFISPAIYLMAQAELFATVIPGFPVWNMAGFLGSTLWLIWLIVLGIMFLRNRKIT